MSLTDWGPPHGLGPTHRPSYRHPVCEQAKSITQEMRLKLAVFYVLVSLTDWGPPPGPPAGILCLMQQKSKERMRLHRILVKADDDGF